MSPGDSAAVAEEVGADPGDEPSELAALGGLALIASLVVALILAWNSPVSEGRYNLREAQRLLREGRYTPAISLLERTLPGYSAPEARLALSYGYLARRDTARAERQARLAAERARIDIETAARVQIGRALWLSGKQDEALALWEEARKVEPSGPVPETVRAASRSAAWHAANAYWLRGDWQRAGEILETLLVENDHYAASARVRLSQLAGPGDLARSHALASAVQAGSPEGKYVPDMRIPGLSEGLTEDRMTRDLEVLRRAHDEAGRTGADAATLDALWGSAYLQMGEERLAVRYLERAVAARPDFAEAHARLALALVNLGEEDRALSHLQTAVQHAPRSPLPHQVLARLYTVSGQWEEAAAELTILREIEPGNVEVHLQLAEFFRLRGQYTPAEDAFIDAVSAQRLAGKSEGVNAALALARFYTDVLGVGCEKGLPVARESLAEHPGDAASLDAVGWATVQCKHPADALPFLEQAVEREPAVARYRYHLASAYADLGRYRDANEQFVWVTDLDPGGDWEKAAIEEIIWLPDSE